jgi:hypothetical protein
MITTEKLEELEKLAKTATPGPWFPQTYSDGHRQICGNERDVSDDEAVYSTISETVYKREDHEYLCALSPEIALSLIAEVRTLQADSERYRWAISLEDNAETLLAAVMSCGPKAVKEINIEIDAAIDAAKDPK